MNVSDLRILKCLEDESSKFLQNINRPTHHSMQSSPKSGKKISFETISMLDRFVGGFYTWAESSQDL
jgi:hypothetical protein